ncbi:alpha/beta fold hydrolase [Kribbella sandramycini]|uniref:Alpha/beta fold hydrolase n=1 Tax=Kribbella sandramycini TaxID=60450 RepID=A0A7Y4KW37_9ACTN|nr:alpha/beta hydrolase [Kribbella sandramycini]MBB6567641.1 pimeloyl-ACP methyl ester carboxylesterase [Kribbella sandramycini]NOL39757.1 alpha/beta fold hydrolase [Kribbella sandramycini]
MRRVLSVGVAVILLGASLVPATAQAAVQWGACPANYPAGLECSTLMVPLDYRRPDERQIEIALTRLPSKAPAKRRGVLLVNPGGPGLPGAAVPVVLELPQSVRDSYDVIGFDPRGVGRSTPLTCNLTEAQSAVAAAPPYPLNSADVAKAAEIAKTVARQCTTSETAELLPHITTANTARDMDRIRAALGEPKLSYYGDSYGTYLGAVYTTLFPYRSDRIVLDSALPPEGYDVDALRDQGLGFQERFPDFARFAAADPQRYGLGATPAAVTVKWFQLTKRLDQAPIQGYDGTLFRTIAAFYLRAEFYLKDLAELMHALDTSRPLPTARKAAAVDDRGSFPVGHLAVICGDSRWPTSVRTYQTNVAIDRIRYPLYGAWSANIRPCAYWPAPATAKTRITDRGPSSVLILQNERDPATPLRGAKRLRNALGAKARMVVVDQGGHGAYNPAMNACGNAAVTTFLLTGHRPPRDTFCPAESVAPPA